MSRLKPIIVRTATELARALNLPPHTFVRRPPQKKSAAASSPARRSPKSKKKLAPEKP